MKNPMHRWALAALLTVLTFVGCVAVAEAHGLRTSLGSEHTPSVINPLESR
jgi:hypothetical protein